VNQSASWGPRNREGMVTKPKYWSLLKKVSLSKGWFHLFPVSKDDIYQVALTTSATKTPWFLNPQ